ncbi:MAG: peroxiredoxin-like family protein [Pseudomonadota bacterium]
MNQKLAAGAAMPELEVPSLAGTTAQIGGTGRWQMVLIYRGKHCPLCDNYLAELQEMAGKFAERDVDLLVVSGDPQEKASAQAEKIGLDIPVAYDMSVEQMRRLGLYVSTPRSPQETDRPFAEPGLFVVNPEGNLQILDISNSPFSRPNLNSILGGIAYSQDNGYPIRGTG